MFTRGGSGSVVGGVRSTPAGIECALAVGDGRATRECAADFAKGERVTLTFVPGGASGTAQFYLQNEGGHTNCAGAEKPAAAANSCTVALDEDLTVEIFPISIPPPPPP